MVEQTKTVEKTNYPPDSKYVEFVDDSLPKHTQQKTKASPEIIGAINKWSNSFFRPSLPGRLMDKSTINQVQEEGAKLLDATFMYGIRAGTIREIPYDQSEVYRISNLETESLWLYDTDLDLQIPEGFKEKTDEAFFISTGRTRKCPNCAGQGRVRCSSCKGRIRWHEEKSDGVVERICSCGDGKETCHNCAGYQYMLKVIECATDYKLSSTKEQDYSGNVPKNLLAQTTGQNLFEKVIEYPVDQMKQLLTGGLNPREYLQLQSFVREKLHQTIIQELGDYAGNRQLVHELIDKFFDSIPDATQQNKLMELELIPLKIRVAISDAPVYQIDYQYKKKSFQTWVYGNERKIYAPKRPSGFTIKTMGWLSMVAALGFAVFSFLT